VLLGLLSGGGLLLAITFLATMTVIVWAGLRAIRHGDGSERSLYVAVLASWVAYHVQSSVSMDMPGLIFSQWILGGVLLVGGTTGKTQQLTLPWSLSRVGSGSVRSHKPRQRTLGALLAVVVAFALLVDPLSAPLRADLAAYSAQEALDRTDFQTAGEDLLLAIDLQPRNGMYAEGMAIVYENSGLSALALEERLRSAHLRPGNPYSALIAAQSAVDMGRFGDGEYWLERSVSTEPNGAEVLAWAAELAALTGAVDRAAELLDAFELLKSSNLGAWGRARNAYAVMGDDVRVERASRCSAYGQVGCWPDD